MAELLNDVDEFSDMVNKKLQEYENGIGLPELHPNSKEIEALLNLDMALIRKYSAEQCGESAVMLSRFAFHIQKCYNKEMALFNWANSMINRTIGSELNQYKAFHFEEKKMLAIKGNDRAKKLEEIKIKVQLRTDRLAYMSSRIESLKDTFLELQQTKRRTYGS